VTVERPGVRFSWLEKGPKLLHVAYIVAISLKGFEIFASSHALFAKRASRVLLALSTVSLVTSGYVWTPINTHAIG
jgi:hypothetical protein